MNEDVILDNVIALWKQADAHSDQADLLSREADNQSQMANELEDRAEELWRPLAEAHPEWVDALRSAQDPRG
jgi:hypothetical protein